MACRNKYYDLYADPKGWGGRMMLKHMNKGKHADLAKWALRKVAFRKTDSVLDIGCGGGANLGRMLKLCPKGQVMGLDHSRLAVKMSLKENRKAVSNGRCQVIQGSVSPLPFWNGNFQVVTAFETIYYWPSLTEAFREVHRVLDDDGKFLIANCMDPADEESIDSAKKVPGMTVHTPGEIERRLKDAGFRRVRIYRKKRSDFTAIVASK